MFPLQFSTRPPLEAILQERNLQPCFQAIVSLDHQDIYGYEGLIRGPKGSVLHSPTTLFQAAKDHGLLTQLDLLCRELVVQQFGHLGLRGKLFLNMNPKTLLEEDLEQGCLEELLRESGVKGNCVVIELTEGQPIEDIAKMQKVLEHYRSLGIRSALDDLGTGYSGLKVWSQLRPDMVKIDRHFIQQVDSDKTRQQFIRNILEMANSMGATVICEGVESREEYGILRNIGAKLVQGYYFARPQTHPPLTLDSALFRSEIRARVDHDGHTVESLLRPATSVPHTSTVMTVGELFIQRGELETIVVVNGDEVLGVVLKKDFMNIYAVLYGKELYGREAIVKFMKTNILKLDKNLSLKEASYRLTTSLDLHTEEFLILENNKLLGRGLLIDLLHEITTVRVQQARYANPLTMLPGNVPIQQQLQLLIKNNKAFTICYFDLDNFKPFNDIFGFSKGDEAILLVAELLRDNTDPRKTFIGHIGGDDFVLIFRTPEWLGVVESILRQFDRRVVTFYHGKAQYASVTKDRQGKLCTYAQMTLSVGAVVLEEQQVHLHTMDLSEEAACAKHHAKMLSGSRIYIHRPQTAEPFPLPQAQTKAAA